MSGSSFQETGESFVKLQQALSDKAERVKQLFSARVEDSVVKLQASDLLKLEDLVSSLERQIDELEHFADEEMQEVSKVEALQRGLEMQTAHVKFISENLPPHLPAFQHQQEPSQENMKDEPMEEEPGQLDQKTVPTNGGERKKTQVHVQQPKKPQPPRSAPQQFVSKMELASVSSYMRGRLTLEKVNDCIKEIAMHAEAKAKYLSSVRSGGGWKLPADQRKDALELIHAVGKHDAIKNHFWFEESDLKNGTHLKPDRSGRSMLILLRHLGRINEVRLTVEATTRVIYTIL